MIRADLHALALPSDADLQRAQTLIQQSVTRLLVSAEKLAVSSYTQAIAPARAAVDESNALQAAAFRHMKMFHC